MAEQARSSKFENLLNFRDVADSINEATHAKILSRGRFYRSARPDSISSADREILRDTYCVKTIIDLRSKTEHLEAAQKYSKAMQLANSAAVPLSNAQIAEAIKIPGMKYEEINLNGRGFERHLVWQLRYRDLAWLAGYMLFGYRLEGISIIGKNVLQPRGLIGLGTDTLQHSGPEIKQVFDVLANPSSYPVLLHCTQGKDRTGLIVVLVLLLCRIDIDAITNDYVKSESELQPEFEDRMKEIRSIGLDETFAKCPHEFASRMAAFLESEYGGVEQYLLQIGISISQIEQIRKQMLG